MSDLCARTAHPEAFSGSSRRPEHVSLDSPHSSTKDSTKDSTMAPVTLKAITFPGYEAITDRYAIAAAIVVPANYLTLVTSGHVGLDAEGNLADTIEQQIRLTFENVEKSILAAAPFLTKTQAWSSVYQITSYIKGDLDDAAVNSMFKVASETLGEHKPAWTCVGVEDLVLGRYEMAIFAAIPPA
ncbi:hypothetical protein B0A52_07029 [Exophiala mesophila]|uniref:YjgF-like protein n=1 Tax=Exophiala mesophila TaxID=212818 RepID=A0A438MXX3_EXOME|nr:hypothetical protein B0A52_07029 [Exophiala mesophila]